MAFLCPRLLVCFAPLSLTPSFPFPLTLSGLFTLTLTPLAADILRKLEKDGARIILLTMREGDLLEDAVKECRRAGIPLWAVNQNPDQHLWGAARKVYADAYVDDHAIAFPRTAGGDADWNAIGLLLEQAMRLHKPA